MQRLDLSSNKVVSEESRIKAFLWPNLNTLPGAESAIDIGKVAAYVITVLTCAFLVFRRAPVSAFLDAAVIGALGFGIGKKSRICAVLALVVYLSEQAFAYVKGFGSWNIAVLVIIVFLFVNAARGTFAYHRLKKQ